MKKQSILALAAIAAVSMTTGCASSKITGGGHYAGIPTPTPEPYKVIYEHNPNLVTAKGHIVRVLGMNFGDEAPRLLNQRNDPGFFENIVDGGASVVQNAALFKACDQSKADAILAARYKLEKKDYFLFAVYDCEIKGFPANLKAIEKVVEKDEKK